MKNILVAEDHPLVLSGIQHTLHSFLPDAEITKAHNFNIALKALDTQVFDLMIMDINMPGGGKVAMVHSVRLRQADLPILVCSSYEEQLYALPFLRAGANGFISKTAPNHEFVSAVETVMNAGIYASPGVLRSAFELLHHSKADNATSKLSDKELEIVKLLSQGLPIKTISEMVNLSAPSVSNYKTRIFEKLGVSNVIEMTTYFSLNEDVQQVQ
jgi:DNA-binding NarL/FixJ family response regulator